jgi:PAS domain S-box-containing protein
MRSIRFQHPFWLTIFLSGGFALLTLILLALQASQDRAWLPLMGASGLLVFAHLIAWWQAATHQRMRFGLWLIIAAQLLSAVLLPFLVADAWMIGLMLLVVVPLEAGVSDQMRRMPIFTLVALLTAALMVSVDLLALPGRMTLDATAQSRLWWFVGLIVLHLIGLVFLLWVFRLRPGTSHVLPLDLTTQLSLLFTGIAALSILTVAGVLITQIRQAQIREVGHTFQTTAETAAERVGNLLELQINALAGLVRQESALIDAVAAANAAYPESVEAVAQALQEQEQRWQTGAETSDFVMQHRSGPALLAMNAFRGQNVFFNQMLLTDRAGGLVVAQGDKPQRFIYQAEDWWQTAWNHGQGDIFLGHLTLDPVTNVPSLLIALRVINPKTNEPIGVIAATYELRAAQQLIDLANERVSRQTFLFSADGSAIRTPEQAAMGLSAWESLHAANLFTTELAGTGAGAFQPLASDWQLGTDRQGLPTVLAYSNLNNTSQVNLNPIRRLGWQVVVSDTQANALAEVTRSTKVASLVALLTMAGVLLMALVTARLITRPIEALTATAGAIKEGDLTVHAQPAGSIELVTLAQTFNSMTEQLQKAFQTLQASEAKFRSLFEDSKDAIFISRADGRLVDLNPAGLVLFGLGTDEIEQIDAQKLYANPADRAQFRQAIEQNGAVSDFEVKMQRRDGSQFDALITATLRHNEDGAFAGYQGLVRDITVQKQNERLQAENLRLSTELEVTQRLQRMILPKTQELQAIEGLEIAGYMEPADEVGGDYYDVLQHNGHVKIGIGDVTGHGLESGVLMLMTQMGVRTLLTHDESNPVQFMDVLNRTLYHNVRRMGIDKSLTLALLDYQPQPEGGGHLWASGQHEELIVVRQGGVIERVDTLNLGFPIGLDADIAHFIGRRQVKLQAGDGAVLYTDGITEAENAANEQYGLERLCETIRQHWDEPADAIKTVVIDDVRQFIGEQTVFDDITLLVLKQQ